MTRFILAFAAFTALTADAATSYSVTVKNSWNEAKKDEPVVIRLEDKKVQSARIIRKGSSDPVPCQLDDLDGDTYPDELVFLVDIAPGETQQYSVTLSGRNEKVEAPHFASRTYADMMLEDKKNKYPKITSLEAPGESYLYNDLYHHGAAWENEVTAYRIYFDQRQNIDIYGKKLRRLELADTHFYTTPEQMKQDYGNDVLWAGNSVGCGSFKGYDGKPLNIEPVATRGQKVVATGPLRTVIQVTDKGWQHPNGSTLNMTQWYINMPATGDRGAHHVRRATRQRDLLHWSTEIRSQLQQHGSGRRTCCDMGKRLPRNEQEGTVPSRVRRPGRVCAEGIRETI